MQSTLFNVDNKSYQKKLNYNKFKITISIVPVHHDPWNEFHFNVKDNYDFNLVRLPDGRKFFIPTYKTLDRFFDPAYSEEYVTNPTGGADMKKLVPLDKMNVFLKSYGDYPIFYGYFETLDKANKAYSEKLKPVLYNEIAVVQKITNKDLINKILTFHLKAVK